MKRSRFVVISVGLVAAGACLGVALAPRLAGAGGAGSKGPAVIDGADFDTLQQAVAAIPKEGGVLRLPPGTFELREPLVLRSENLRVEGSGAATHIVNRNEEGQPAVIIAPDGFDKNPKGRLWRVQLADLRISGNPKSGDGLLAQGVNEIYLHGLSVDHNGGHGVNLADCYEDPRVSDCILTYNAKAGLNILRGHDIVVSGNQFEENQDALWCVDSFNLCMNGNNLDDHLRHGVVIENTYGSVLSGNMIEECQGTAVILDRDCYGITVSANVIAHNFGGGVDLKDAWGCAVSANTFTIVGNHALTVGANSGRIAVTGNSFSNSYIGGKELRLKQDYAGGVLLDGTADVALSGNTFTGLAGTAVELRGPCQRVNVTGNVMADLHRQGGAAGAAVTGEGATLADNVVDRQNQAK